MMSESCSGYQHYHGGIRGQREYDEMEDVAVQHTDSKVQIVNLVMHEKGLEGA